MSEKIIGYLLLFSGVVLILLSAINVYMVFTKRTEAFPLFSFSGISLDMTQALTANLPEAIKSQLQSSSPNKQEIISAEMVNQPMNIFAQVVLMGFLSSIGVKLAEVGAMLLRPVVVKVKESQS